MRSSRLLPSLLLSSTLAIGSGTLLHCGSGDDDSNFLDQPDAAGTSSSGSVGIGGNRDGGPQPQEPGKGTCGDAKLALEEECDDGNATGADGCSATCALEAGWSCPVIGLPCEAAKCGDAVVAGAEECEPVAGSVGCSSTCTIEPGYDCDPVSAVCTPVVCGDGVIGRGESCEEASPVPFDGCYLCHSEPACSGGVCQATCGDGQRFAAEACDDGNTRDGDGCSKDCVVEAGFACNDVSGTPPPAIALPILVRDFIGVGNEAGGSTGHNDFNGFTGPGAPGVVLPNLGPDGRPDLNCPNDDCTKNPAYLATGGRGPNMTDRAHFDQWYTQNDQNIPGVKTVSLALQENGTYTWDSGDRAQNDGKAWFDPFGEGGWVALGKEAMQACPNDPEDGQGGARNVSFTSETHFWFEYNGGERFDFAGDDDTWIFVNGKLAVDIGGLHGPVSGHFILDADSDDAGPDVADGHGTSSDERGGNTATDFGLTAGGVYEVVMFQAERNECGSNFKVTLKNFNRPKSACVSTCGDGIVVRGELCDDGVNDGAYGGCAPGCKARGPYCGDGVVAEGEQCDDGNTVNADGCSNGCTKRAVN